MPAEARVPAEVRMGTVLVSAGDSAGADGGGHRHGVPAIYPACQPVHAGTGSWTQGSGTRAGDRS